MRSSVSKTARTLLNDEQFCRNAERRIQAVSNLVDRLPRTAPDIEMLLTRAPHRLSREVQYTVLNCLDFSTINPQHIDRLLPAVKNLLCSIDSGSAMIPLKLGCVLGGGWYKAGGPRRRRKLEDLLCESLRSAGRVYARRSALHGIEHMLNQAPLLRGKALLNVVREVAVKDRALSLRKSAYFILHRGDWWGRGGPKYLHQYARSLGRNLLYPKLPSKQSTVSSKRH